MKNETSKWIGILMIVYGVLTFIVFLFFSFNNKDEINWIDFALGVGFLISMLFFGTIILLLNDIRNAIKERNYVEDNSDKEIVDNTDMQEN